MKEYEGKNLTLNVLEILVKLVASLPLTMAFRLEHVGVAKIAAKLETGECAKPVEGTTCAAGEFCQLGTEPTLRTACCAESLFPSSGL